MKMTLDLSEKETDCLSNVLAIVADGWCWQGYDAPWNKEDSKIILEILRKINPDIKIE